MQGLSSFVGGSGVGNVAADLVKDSVTVGIRGGPKSGPWVYRIGRQMGSGLETVVTLVATACS